jgi:hypothetical protein
MSSEPLNLLAAHSCAGIKIRFPLVVGFRVELSDLQPWADRPGRISPRQTTPVQLQAVIVPGSKSTHAASTHARSSITAFAVFNTFVLYRNRENHSR